ncbi:WhiB family transcriptional regulator [Mycolicibacterium sp. 018/SC-01/001]|uniref:WhiB family transcriptional regulator n=1 Tax=Mycolicibacterium sp. 018/SC-01/001 TaxID=2592069 RepID=UPI00117F4977|nr:WhiB family transcriptional regulator [Mycolicibacterium sp. 018/SC-01/001]TRW78552.1 WhiB family transcriptional regulator [Mycolicibacterium sp. 018/SC-01/001]
MTGRSGYLNAFTHTHSLRLPPPIQESWSWQWRGTCRDYPVEMFFPDDPHRAVVRRKEKAAVAICRQCPVLQQCRDHALRTPEQHGVWGAMTAGERGRLLRHRSA